MSWPVPEVGRIAEVVVLGIIAAIEVAFFGWALTDVRRRFPAHRTPDRAGRR